MIFGWDIFTFEIIILAFLTIIISILLASVFDFSRLNGLYNSKHCAYGYSTKNGPHEWKDLYPNARGENQSPIDISSRCSICVPVETLPELSFSSEYQIPPQEIRAFHDGHTVTIFARWEHDCRPKLCGGPLEEPYKFFYVKFRWGPNDEEGSEHTLDSRRYAMEVQATHVKETGKYYDTNDAADDGSLLIISYFYQITPIDNPYLEPFISALKFIRCPFESCTVEATPLSWIVQPFNSKYLIYTGSLTHPPCTEGVKWMLQTEPLGISSRQLRKFRKLVSHEGPLELNTRPVQAVNHRNICYYD